MTTQSLETAAALVELRQVSFGFAGRKVLDGVDLCFPRGKVTTIMGPSGTGKTTTLRLITGQLRPHAGTVRVAGQEVSALDHAGLFQLRKRMGMMFQSGALFADLDVFENVAFPLRAHTDLPESMIRDVVLMKLEAVGLRGARRLMPAALSAGMARRVALARAVALDPMLMLYDEPFTGQDPITVGMVMKLIRELNDNLGLTSILVSHDVKEIMAISDFVYIISQGQVIGRGSPAQLQRSDSPWIRQFIHGEREGPAAFHYPAPDYAEDLLA